MHEDFRDKVVIIAGGAGGIGASQARKLSAAGAHVVVADRQEEEGRALVASMDQMAGPLSLFDSCSPSEHAGSWFYLAIRAVIQIGR